MSDPVDMKRFEFREYMVPEQIGGDNNDNDSGADRGQRDSQPQEADQFHPLAEMQTTTTTSTLIPASIYDEDHVRRFLEEYIDGTLRRSLDSETEADIVELNKRAVGLAKNVVNMAGTSFRAKVVEASDVDSFVYIYSSW